MSRQKREVSISIAEFRLIIWLNNFLTGLKDHQCQFQMVLAPFEEVGHLRILLTQLNSSSQKIQILQYQTQIEYPQMEEQLLCLKQHQNLSSHQPHLGLPILLVIEIIFIQAVAIPGHQIKSWALQNSLTNWSSQMIPAGQSDHLGHRKDLLKGNSNQYLPEEAQQEWKAVAFQRHTMEDEVSSD
ncbi:hypothetical protein CPB84DRAFT_1747041 [Gymnopilus junonius]|uniref:Uncharacterized protein n=1 Tax=Gymnopilus junonius TaxID=109634 RepID=A0A9P5TMI7_GYMJU|nr:hypothetical protein CPB84DRAFT_1747041 [Gymnopilus junonius]